ncbi:tetratricopeptide repeat protein [Rhizobium laguerreae]|uniref:tetratricopeptide repeat protein n=1 Tax=Rhizobium laguerreae TaxID=1076926 RepID=UPI0014413883|nr:tetratricopeptide repeat protein [Rhizobium laguerreae]
MDIVERIRSFFSRKSVSGTDSVEPIIMRISENGAAPTELILDENLMQAELEMVEAGLHLADAPHEASALIARAADRFDRYPGPDVSNVIELLVCIAELALALDHTGRAKSLLVRAMKAEELASPGIDTQLIRILILLAEAQSRTGDLDGAADYLERAVTMSDKRGSPQRDTLSALQALAVVRQNQGRPDASFQVYERLVADSASTEGPESVTALDASDSLTRAYLQNGEPARALAVAEKAQQLRETRWGTDHPETAAGLDSLALAWKRNGDIDRALDLQIRAAEIFAASGDTHPSAGRAIGNLAGTLLETGHKHYAVCLLSRALAAKEGAFGKTHPSLPHTLSNMAVIAAGAAAFGVAEPLIDRAHAILVENWGASHPETQKAKELLDRIKSDRRSQAAFLATEDRVREIEAEFLTVRRRS